MTKFHTSMGGAQDVERLNAAYEQIEKAKAFEDRPEPPSAPKTKDPKDPFRAAKHLSGKLMQDFMLLNMEYGSGPDDMIYAAELFVLNLYNARNCPISKERIQAIRKSALEYYTASLSKIPDAPPPGWRKR